eukprot:TRINITY_DN6624_c0_g1_i2.p1 TRINITY_DN6624_c0_g1~~TRINITY_DN6624_c0_g1_i2.p1  ORF type:complete len:1223 (-),score=447.26 TRINITY_DN6624_c0_g1_i2:317-3985(-)
MMERSESDAHRNGLEIVYKDKKLQDLPSELFSDPDRFISLRTLRLNGNELKNLPEKLFTSFPILEKLILDSNLLNHLPKSIQSHAKIRVIRLKNNKFTSFPLDLLQISSLRKLDLSFNQIDEISTEIFDRSLQSNEKPKKILLNGNPLPLGFATVVANFFSRDKTIEFSESDLHSSQLNKTIRRSRSNSNPTNAKPSSNANNNNDFISLSSSPSNPFKIPESISKLNHLEAFSARKCKLKELNESFYQLNQIRYVDLAFNSFDSIPIRIFETFSNLKELCLSNNRITSVPREISKLSSLKILLLDNNLISDFPDSFFELKNLRILRLSSNRLKRIPQEFVQFQKLESLHANNNLIDQVPEHVYSLPKLRTFTLEGNSLPLEFYETYDPILSPKSNSGSNQSLQFLCVSDEDFEEKEGRLSTSSSSSSLYNSREELPFASSLLHSPPSSPSTSMTNLRDKMMAKKMLNNVGMLNNGRPASTFLNNSTPISIPSARNKEPSRAASSEYLTNRPPVLKRAGSLVMGGDDSPFNWAIMASTPPSTLSRGATMSDLDVKAMPYKEVWDPQAIDHVRKRLSTKIVLEQKFSDLSFEELKKELDQKFEGENKTEKTPNTSQSKMRAAGTSIPPALQIRKTESEHVCVIPSNRMSVHESEAEEPNESESPPKKKKDSIRSKFQSLFHKKSKKPNTSDRVSLDTTTTKKTIVNSSSSSRVDNSINAIVSPPRNERALRKTVSVSEYPNSPISPNSPNSPNSPPSSPEYLGEMPKASKLGSLGRFKGVSLTRKKGIFASEKVNVEHSSSFPSILPNTPVIKAESREVVEIKPEIHIEAKIDLLVDQEADGSHVYACSLPAIVKLLLREDFGKYFEKALVYTYTCFTNTLELIRTIFNELNEETFKRALEVISHLKSVFPAEFGEDRKEIIDLLRSKPELYAALTKKDSEEVPQQKKEPALIAPNKSKRRDLLSFHPEELARQMALIESELFRNIEPVDYLSNSWKKGAPVGHIGDVINHFNETSRWVSTEIVMAETVDDRINIITHFLMVASRCVRINNFNGAMEIFSGLEALSVSRLKQTWQKLPKDSKKIMEELGNFMSVVGNWKALRKAVATCTPPAVPYIGIAMADLVFIDEHPNEIEGADGSKLINWRKFEMIAQVVQKMHRLKYKEYNYEQAPAMREYLKNVLVLGDQALFQKSVEKEGKDENVAFMAQQQKKEKKTEKTRKNTLS